MTGAMERLMRCFQAVFPGLSRDEMFSASTQTVSRWDSLATVTLVALLEQEFDIRIDLLDLAEFHSFESVTEYLRDRGVLGSPEPADG